MIPARLSTLLAALMLAAPTSLAQDAPAPRAHADSPALPSVAEIERAWAAGDFVQARQGLGRLAEETGDAVAQYRYGRMLLEGRGGPVDVDGAIVWLERAVAQGSLPAAALLGRVFLSPGLGGPGRDPQRAAALFSDAAARGDAESQYYLGLMHREGVGVEQNPKAAFELFLAAAEQGHTAAQYELARAFSRGEGTTLDTAEALHWLGKAAAAGHGEAQLFLALALDTGQGAERDRDAARQWFRRAAEGGNPIAQRRLGAIYLTGDGTEANTTEAMRWLGRAARAGDLSALHLLGVAWSGGHGLEADPAKAARFWQQASEAGYAPSSIALGRLLETGTGRVAPDLERAVAFYRRAVQQGDPAAAPELGRLAGAGQLDGLAPPHLAVSWAMAAAAEGDTAALDWVRRQADAGLRPARTAYGRWLATEGGDPAAGAAHLLAAAEAGDVEAQYLYGVMLSRGDGVDQDYVQAHAWLNAAAAGGNPEAAKTRDVLGELMTPDQVAEAQAMTRAFFERAAGRPAPVSGQ